MRYRIGLAIVAMSTILACAGGGGDFGFDSDVVVELEGMNGSNADQLFLSIVPDEGIYNSPAAASSTQEQSWVNRSKSAALQRFQFLTRGSDVPYQVWVGTVGAVDRDCQIVITVDGVEQFRGSGTVSNGTPQKVVKINRNFVDGFGGNRPVGGLLRK